MPSVYIPKLTQLPSDLLSLADYERLARDFMPHPTFEYIDGGGGDELTRQANQTAFDSYQILPRSLQDFSRASTHCQLWDQHLAHPILLAPVAYQRLVHPQGELATAAAADAMDSGFICSTLSSFSLEDIARETRRKWFQLYLQPTRAASLELIRRAEAAGYQALVVTIDVPLNGLRQRPQRAGFSLPDDVQAVNLLTMPAPAQRQLNPGQSLILDGVMADAPRWQDIEWLRSQTRLPLLIKGILHPEDARQARDLGADAVIVSNHGGRSLDGVPASVHMLASIRAAVGRDFTLLLDSGIRRGTDIFKALALGANAVMIGRPQIYGLAVAGALGVAHTLKLLREELEMTMALAGTPTLAAISARNLLPAALTPPASPTR